MQPLDLQRTEERFGYSIIQQSPLRLIEPASEDRSCFWKSPLRIGYRGQNERSVHFHWRLRNQAMRNASMTNFQVMRSLIAKPTT